MKINCGLIVSDFDGTLIDDNQRILPEVKEAIDEYVAAGGIFAVCTGRMPRSILPRVRELGLKGLVIAYQGTVIADIETGRLIRKGGMECGGAAELCRYFEEAGYGINVYSDDNIYTDFPEDSEAMRIYENIIKVKAINVKGKLSDYVLKNKMFCQKVISIVPEDKREEVYYDLNEKLGARFDITCSARVLVEASPYGDNKGEALKFLSSYYKVPIEKTVAAGDNLNDLSMIQAAGIGCAVGNADILVKKAADFVSVSNNEGALAQIIKKFGFA